MDLQKKLNGWKEKLLDLGKGNALINFKLDSKSIVRFTSPSMFEFWKKIVEDEKNIEFSCLDESESILYKDDFSIQQEASDENEDYYEKIIADEYEYGEVCTTRPKKDVQRTLRALKKKYKEFMEEQDVNILYLSFGILEWTESSSSREVIASPLILVPVSLEQESINSPIVLKATEDEIVINPTLNYKLKNDFGLNLPEYEDTDLDSLVQKLEGFASENGWTFWAEVCLSILSFLKINMYNDLEKHRNSIISHAIINAFAGNADQIKSEKFGEIAKSIEDFDHDSQKTRDVFQIVDADSSQQDAIVCADKGISFVLQGPPGTGKSQTITNIIASKIANGKKVLFVSEKKAALDVVYKRLKESGLSDFVLTLHSNKENKKETLEQLENVLALSQKKVSVKESAAQELEKFEKDRDELNDYAKQIGEEIKPLGKSIFYANGIISKLSDVQDISFPIPSVRETSETQYDGYILKFGRLASIIGEMNDNPSANPWRNTNVPMQTNEFHHNLSEKKDSIKNAAEKFRSIYRQIESELGISIGLCNLENTEKLLSFLKKACESPTISSDWLEKYSIPNLEKIAAEHKGLKNDFDSLTENILSEYDKDVFSIDFKPIEKRYKYNYSSAFRIFKPSYWKDQKFLKQLLKNPNSQKSWSEKMMLFENLNKRIELENQLEKYSLIKSIAEYKPIAEILTQKNDGADNIGNISDDWNDIKSVYIWCKDFISACKYLGDEKISSNFILRICRENECKTIAKRNLNSLEEAHNKHKDDFIWFAENFEDSEILLSKSFDSIKARITDCHENMHSLELWIDYRKINEEIKSLGFSEYLDKIESGDVKSSNIVLVFEKRFFYLWLDSVYPEYPAVANFRHTAHEKLIEEFSQLDKKQLKIAQLRIKEHLINSLPDFDAFTGGEVNILKRELNKKRKIMPIRKLFNEIPNILLKLKPCLMMSPLSVSQFLESENYKFDTVIFDEASQVKTENAIGAIFRGKQVIIAGDGKQLPPTNFFEAMQSDYDEDEEEESLESVLDEASVCLPNRELRWHYRSQHEHLIAFSNSQIYKNKLITFPSNREKLPDWGVEYIYVENGIYSGKGNQKGNYIEAERVADEIFKHIHNHPERSLGVITFGTVQEDTINAVITERRKRYFQHEDFFREDNHEPFFVKSLEQVQGDERDTIIFSIGYAKDSSGKMAMRFGPLSQDGGERRLNVAITRAKYNVKLIGSIKPADIDIERVSKEGPKLLRKYIEFAMRGIEVLQKENEVSEELWFDSPFEKSVYDFLKSQGYEVSTQVGCSGYRIDMAIKHPSLSGIFVLGIECDGATYHSSRTARERDRLRQNVLEMMGWKIYRIWSTDWIKSPHEEKRRLLEAIKAAIATYREDFSPSNTQPSSDSVKNTEIDELFSVADKTDEETGHGFSEYQEFITSDCQGNLSIDHIVDMVKLEQPVHLDIICQRFCHLLGKNKVTTLVKKHIKDLMDNNKSRFVQKDDFYSFSGKENSLKVRTAGNRQIKYISLEEISEGMLSILTQGIGLTEQDMLAETKRSFGFKRTGANIEARLKECIEMLKQTSKIATNDGKIDLL